MHASLRLVVRAEEEGFEVVGVVVDLENHVAAATAVTSVRASFWLKFLASEAGASVTAVAGFRVDFDVVDKHGDSWAGNKGAGRGLTEILAATHSTEMGRMKS